MCGRESEEEKKKRKLKQRIQSRKNKEFFEVRTNIKENRQIKENKEKKSRKGDDFILKAEKKTGKEEQKTQTPQNSQQKTGNVIMLTTLIRSSPLPVLSLISFVKKKKKSNNELKRENQEIKQTIRKKS